MDDANLLRLFVNFPTDNFSRLAALSVVIGAGCGFIGMYVSYYVDVSSGANIVLVAAAAFVLAMAYSAVRQRLATARGLAAGPVAPSAAREHALFE